MSGWEENGDYRRAAKMPLQNVCVDRVSVGNLILTSCNCLARCDHWEKLSKKDLQLHGNLLLPRMRGLISLKTV